MSFVEQEILPRYNAFGRSHGLQHVQRVIRNAIDLARLTGADLDMVYAIAAYHDLGMEGPRAIHHVTGGKILMADKRLTRWFSPTQIRIMKEAVEDHRASSSRMPRSIYGKSSLRLTGTSNRLWSSREPSSLGWKTILCSTKSSNGSVFDSISRRNMVVGATSICGYRGRPMPKT